MNNHSHGPESTSLSAHDVRRLSAQGEVHPNTIARAYSGKPVRSLSLARIERAARELGLPLPNAAQSGAGR